MLVSYDLIGQLNEGHFLNVNNFYKGYSREGDIQKMSPARNVCPYGSN